MSKSEEEGSPATVVDTGENSVSYYLLTIADVTITGSYMCISFS